MPTSDDLRAVKLTKDMDELLGSWDRLNSAIDRTLTALPQQMTEAITRLEGERLAFRTVIQRHAFDAGRRALAAAENGR